MSRILTSVRKSLRPYATLKLNIKNKQRQGGGNPTSALICFSEKKLSLRKHISKTQRRR